MKNVVALFISLTSLFIMPCFASDGVINFSGKITDQSCEIDTQASTLNVNLGSYSISQFGGSVGVTSLPIPFTIKLKNCPNTEEILRFNVALSGVSESTNPDYLKINDGGAQGVAIVIKDKDGAVVPINKTSPTVYDIPDVEMELKFTAYYISTSSLVKPGDANSTTDITLVYR